MVLSDKARAAIAAANRKKAQDPAYLAKLKAAAKKKSEDPKWRAAIAAANRKKAQDPAWLAANKLRGQDPAFKAKMSAIGKKHAADPEWRGKIAVAVRKRTQDPAWQAAKRSRAQDPEYRARISATLKKKGEDPSWQAELKRIGQKRKENPKWRGRVGSAEFVDRLSASVSAALSDPDVKNRHLAATREAARNRDVRAEMMALKQLPEQLIVELYRNGWLLSEIARKVGTGICPNSGLPRIGRIRTVLKRAGVYKRPFGNQTGNGRSRPQSPALAPNDVLGKQAATKGHDNALTAQGKALLRGDQPDVFLKQPKQRARLARAGR